MEMTAKVTIVLEARQWNDVLDALHSAPFRQAAPIIQEVIKQFQEAEMKSQAAAGGGAVEGQVIPPVPATANGAAHA